MASAHSSTNKPPRFTKTCRDLTGQVFGRLTVVEFATRSRAYLMWKCHCECGRTTIVRSSHLLAGQVQSCGCLVSDTMSATKTTHGMTNTPEFKAWQQMIQRCTNPRYHLYKDWGGRGITVCREWLGNFPQFLADMGHKPSSQHSLDRINNDGPYCPDNCRWATVSRQARNRRSTIMLTHNGETLSAIDWAERTGIPVKRIRDRIHRGLSTEQVLRAEKITRGN